MNREVDLPHSTVLHMLVESHLHTASGANLDV